MQTESDTEREREKLMLAAEAKKVSDELRDLIEKNNSLLWNIEGENDGKSFLCAVCLQRWRASCGSCLASW